MIELRQAVPHHDFARHADPLSVSRSNASGSAIPSGRMCIAMSTMAEARYSTVAKPWLKVRLLDPLDQGLRHRLAGLVVAGEPVEGLRRQHPILVHLARIFDEVARRAAEARIVHVRQEIVDGVAEFVEQGLGIVEADQAGWPASGLAKLLLLEPSTMSSPSRPERLR